MIEWKQQFFYQLAFVMTIYAQQQTNTYENERLVALFPFFMYIFFI